MNVARTTSPLVPANRVSFSASDRAWILARIDEALERGELTLGRWGEAFEREFARLCGRRYAVATSSGTSAIEIALRALGVEGADVLVPANTFVATAAAVIHAGARPVLVDMEPDSFGIGPDEAERALTDRTVAVVTVHVGGIVSARTPALAEWARARRLALVEDAAHAHGSSFEGTPAGGFGVAGAFSFYATKVMTSVEGGMIVTDEEGLAEAARIYRDQGKRSFGENVHDRLGSNWRLSEPHAIVGMRQLERLASAIEERRAIASFYDHALEGCEQLRPLREPPGGRSNVYKYVVLLDEPVDRRALKARLRERYGVCLAGEVYEAPLHRQPVFEDRLRGRFPIAEDRCARHVCLPVFAGMERRDAERAVEALVAEAEGGSVRWRG